MPNLEKGQKIDLTKDNSELTDLIIGLGWDPAKSGFFAPKIDCDASVYLLNEAGRLVNRERDIVSYRQGISSCGSVQYSGDNLTGEGEGDDEQMYIHLPKVSLKYHRLIFAVNIYDCERRKQHFGMIKSAYVRVVNKKTGKELARFNLTDDYFGKTALIVGELYRHKGEWKFGAIGEATDARSIDEIAMNYQ